MTTQKPKHTWSGPHHGVWTLGEISRETRFCSIIEHNGTIDLICRTPSSGIDPLRAQYPSLTAAEFAAETWIEMGEGK